MKQKKKTIHNTFYLDTDIMEKIREEARKNDRKISYIVNSILKMYFARRKNEN